jgi:hypothetical protein
VPDEYPCPADDILEDNALVLADQGPQALSFSRSCGTLSTPDCNSNGFDDEVVIDAIRIDILEELEM